MKERYRVRRAGPRDMETLVHQRHSMFTDIRPRTSEEMELHDSAFRAWALRKMRKKRLFCFLIEGENRKVVAGGSIWLREHQPGPGRRDGLTPYLMSMYTEPEYRGKGLATMLLAYTTDWARKEGYGRIELHASKYGEPVYARFGYEKSNEMVYRFETELKKPSKGRSRRSAR
ncbi:MAG TPA: GNAT family N-acetyltransferase [Nitrososphaerales archaeon]|nr:GNAT family N-acetyltransferase [Nitrososphaerales archaeon]